MKKEMEQEVTMKRNTHHLAVLLAALVALATLMPEASYAGNSSFSFSLGVNAPVAVAAPALPPLTLSAPPPVVAVPGTYVYAAPAVGANLFLYQGYWYRPYNQYWYRAKYYNGPWAYVTPRAVPAPLFTANRHMYRQVAYHRHIPYGGGPVNWGRW